MAEAQENLTDEDLQHEIELVGDLVVAATSSKGPLPQDEIDRLLGVEASSKEDASQESQETNAGGVRAPEAGS